jgi:hypothetical protein
MEVTIHKLPEDVRAFLSTDWHIVYDQRFALPARPEFLLPKRQARTKGSGARTHGGVSMEETIVPVAHFELQRPDTPDLRLQIEGKLTTDSPTRVTLHLANLSDWDVRDLDLDLAPLGMWLNVAIVPAGQDVEVPADAKPSVSGVQPIGVRFRVQGGRWRELRVEVVVEPSESERLLGEDRAGSLLEEDF